MPALAMAAAGVLAAFRFKGPRGAAGPVLLLVLLLIIAAAVIAWRRVRAARRRGRDGQRQGGRRASH